MVADGPMDSEIFLAYVRQFLRPTLQPGGTVILDNLSSHEVAGVEKAITVIGAIVLFLPPYSRDLNRVRFVGGLQCGSSFQVPRNARRTRPGTTLLLPDA